MKKKPSELKEEQTEEVPRFRILLQDDTTGVQIAAGTDDISKFNKTDLQPLVKAFTDAVLKVGEK